MNLRQLYYFKELVEQKQFLKAARNLNISQPSLSNSLKSLETELGCQLVNRSGGKVFLTEYGKIFYKTAIESVSSIEDAKLEIERQKLCEKNIVAIASIPTSFNTFLLSTIKEYQKESSTQARFFFDDALSPEICEGLRSGKYDLGICSKDENYSDLTFLPLYNEELVLITKKNNELAQKDKVSLKDLDNEDIYTYSTKSTLGKNITTAITAKNKNIKIHNFAKDELSLASSVIANDLKALIVKSVFLDHFDLKQIQVDLPRNTRQVYLAYNKQNIKNQEVKNLINYLKNKKGSK